MAEISHRRHRFRPGRDPGAVWLYLRFTLCYRDVGDLLAEGGLDVSYQTIQSWGVKFRPVIGRRLRPRRRGPGYACSAPSRYPGVLRLMRELLKSNDLRQR